MDKPAFELRVLGHTDLTSQVPGSTDGILRQPKRLALLAYLALSTADGFKRRDQIVGLFWPDMDQQQARTYLRKALHGIREDLGADVFQSRGEDELRVDSTKLWCDAAAIGQSVRDGQWSAALALYRGEFLEGLFPEGVAQEFQDWLSAQRRALRQDAATAAWECSRLEEERGDRTAAAVMARRARELDPDNEEGIRRLMGLLDRRGDRGGALRVYSEWQSRMLEEFDVEPDPETRKLARKIQAARKGESRETPPVLPPALPTVPALAAASTSPPIRERSSTKKRMGLASVVGAIALLSAVAIVLSQTPDVPSTRKRSVAVLPLQGVTKSDTGEIGKVIAEKLIAALAADTALTVRAAGAQADGTTDGDIARFGRSLGVAYAVDGSVQRQGSRIRVTLRLRSVSDAAGLWAGSHDAPLEDPAVVAQRVVDQLAPAIIANLKTARRGWR